MGSFRISSAVGAFGPGNVGVGAADGIGRDGCNGNVGVGAADGICRDGCNVGWLMMLVSDEHPTSSGEGGRATGDEARARAALFLFFLNTIGEFNDGIGGRWWSFCRKLLALLTKY